MEIFNVAIIGGGQTALSLAYALRKEGLSDVALFESAQRGLAGPWLTTARMRTLRSPKEKSTGPALGEPQYIFRTWYEKKYGDWESLQKIPTIMWAEYLNWLRETLMIEVHHEWRLLSIVPEKDHFKLLFTEGREARARKVVLATGRSGFGGFEFPEWVAQLPRSSYYHTGEVIPVERFSAKVVAVLGAGASAFDAAAAALENGATHVHMLMRRESVPSVNHLGNFPSWETFVTMDDKAKLEIFQHAWECGPCPPSESIQRLEPWKNFTLHAETYVEGAREGLVIETNKGPMTADLLILATGYAIDAKAVPEIAAFADEILTWSDKHPGLHPKLGRFPYLGEHFEFCEKRAGCAPYLKDLYCLNYGAFLSQGRLCDIDTMAIGVKRLALYLGGGEASVDAHCLPKDEGSCRGS